MRHKSVMQVRVISGSTPEETAMLFNESMQELSALNPKYERDGGVFWIYYTVEQREAETLAEAFEINGEGKCCGDCPFCIRDLNRFGAEDKRKKKATCSQTGEQVYVWSSACDTYYALEKGGSK